MDQLEHHILQVNGIDLSLYSAGPKIGRWVWLLHGFPECWHSWRQQIAPLAAAGYRVLIPEMRGYGQSSAPRDPAAYDVMTICADIQATMDQLGQQQVCVVGHDWGAPIAWHLALLEPDRVKAVVGMAVPFGGRPKQPAIDIMRQLYAERFHYILHFQEPGIAEAEMDADIPRTLRMMMYNTSAAAPKDHFLQEKPAGAGLFDGMHDPATLPAWCDNAAFEHYLSAFEGRGFYGALNWYRNFERNWQRTEALADRQIEQPALFLLGDKDPVGTLEAYTLKQMPKRITQLEQHVLKDCGHWIQNEQAEQVNKLLVDFLRRHYA
ncbi:MULTISPECIES: alpha/beta fold hydrolase [Pseudomonas]|uniref:Alpha/beta hydrolase n=1 Tax=Pseudomonas spirodelae TaxID=3101751 RepID=A0ABU5PCK6_9PSED|nr:MULTISPECIES: alpha/beta hydrolase [unclassified Pseudomonas]MBU0902860.1 alpha/beta hydrolase [Gammaproteobacteria bacterium]MDD2159462.1 alpha/beta hydrolase [Pseudomonas sp. MIL19]MEA1607293.1 alpha/beta hydrolase [Pseudomonas sp. T5W1]